METSGRTPLQPPNRHWRPQLPDPADDLAVRVPAVLVLFIAALIGGWVLALALAGAAWWVHAQVSAMRRRVAELQADADWLLGEQIRAHRAGALAGDTAPPVPPLPAPPPVQAAPPPPAPVPPASGGKPVTAAGPGPKQPALPARPASPPRPAPPPRTALPPFDWDAAWRSVAGPLAGGPGGAGSAEARIGTVWFSRVGALLLIIGGVFAYQYGVTSNILRVLIGYLAGFALLGLGHWGQRRQYRIWAQAVTGAGLGLLYLTTTAGAMMLRPAVIPQPAAFAGMILITALGTGLAVYYDSIAVGLLGMVGGFATPFLLSTGQGDFRLLFAYIALLDLSLLAVAYFKRWPLYNYLLFVATWGIYGMWRGAAFQPGDAAGAFVLATAFFAIFALVSITYNIIHREPARYQDLALAILNGFIYFGSGLDLLEPGSAVVRGLFAFGVAAAHFGLGWLTLARNRQDRLLVLSFMGQAGIFLTVAFPVAFHGPWVTVAWALQGAALIWVSFLAGAPEARYGGLAVLALAAGRLVSRETFPGLFDQPLAAPWLRGFTFLVSVAALYAAAAAYRRFRGERGVAGALAVAASFFTLWYITMEIVLHYSGLRSLAAAGSQALVLPAAWALYGLAVALADLRFREPGVRIGARVVLGLALLWLVMGVLLAPLHVAPGALRWCAFLTVLAAIWGSEWTFRRRGRDRAMGGGLSAAAAAVGFGLVAYEVSRQLAPLLALPPGQDFTHAFFLWRENTRWFATVAAWAAYALLVMAGGVMLRSATARMLAGVFLYTTMAGAMLMTVQPLSAAPGLRLAAFVMVVPGTWLAVYLAARSRSQSGDEGPAEAPLLAYAALAAALLTAWWGAAEIFAWFGTLPAQTQPDRAAAASFAVIAWWGFLALALGRTGVRLRAPAARWAAMALQGVALLAALITVTRHTGAWGLQLAAFAGAILGVYAGHLVLRGPDRSPEEEQAATWLSLAACAFTLVWIGFATHHAYAVEIGLGGNAGLAAASARNHWVLVATGLYGLAVTGAGLWLRAAEARALGLGLQALAVAGAVTVAADNMAAAHWLRLAAYAAGTGGLYAATWLLHRLRQRSTGHERRAGQWLSLAAATLTVPWLLLQVRRFVAPYAAAGTVAERDFALSTVDFGISAAWGVYGLAVLVAGFALRDRRTRLLGLAVLVLTLAKIGVYDMWQLAVVWRIWITIGLGVIFVLASLLYQRFARVILGDDERQAAG